MGKVSAPTTNDDWQIEEDLRTLCKAEEIKKDPARMRKCQEMAKKKQTEMNGVMGMGKGMKKDTDKDQM